MPTILWLDEISASQRELVGGKGLSLARLAAAGFAVPPAYVITTDGLTDGGWHDAAVAALARLAPGGEAVAVRSSAVAEDSAEASFAGQHATILDVRGAEALMAAVEECVASLHSEAAVAYRASGGHSTDEARMAVVVQIMVHADLAGVAFSIDPTTGDTSRVIVEAVAGSGEALVSGQAEADRVVLDRASLAVIEEHRAGEPVLTAELAKEIAAAALRAEEQFGTPQDIEYAVGGGKLWLLQSRPITAAGPRTGWQNEFDTPTTVDDLWTSANVQEVLPGVLTPLTMTTFNENVHRAYTEGYQRLRLLAKDEWPQFVAVFYNRAYLNVGATRLIGERSFGSSGDAVEHRFLGGEYKAKSEKQNNLALLGWRLKSAFPLFKLTIGAHRAADRIDRKTHAMEHRIRAKDPASLSDAKLEERRELLTNFVSDIFAVHLQASGLAGAGFDIVSRSVQPILKEETEGRVPVLFTGMRGVESAQIGLDLWSLSRVAVESGVAEAIRAGGVEPLDDALPATWRAAFEAFIERHGHRGLNEMEPAVKNWRGDPQQIVTIVRSYLDLDPAQSPPAMLERQEGERLALTAQLLTRMNPIQRPIFRRVLREAQQWVALRERTKSIIVRAARLGDFDLPEIERRLIGRRVVAGQGDVFFLAASELSAVLGGHGAADYRAIVSRRRREYERNKHVELPERFYGHPTPIEPDLSHHTGDVLTGTPVSPGTVTGRARVILDPRTDQPIQPGEILVAPVTDAGWTPLFALAAGLVVDMGSALSHGSTVAREYGLPAVVNVRRGTHSIRTGDLLRVDGSKGTVTVIESATT